jgi:hypothetical protein
MKESGNVELQSFDLYLCPRFLKFLPDLKEVIIVLILTQKGQMVSLYYVIEDTFEHLSESIDEMGLNYL